MKLANSSLISKIDAYSQTELGIPILTLMERSGDAVAETVRSMTREGGRVSILAGKGNNGGDGYAAAVKLMDEYEVTVYDIFSGGQKTLEGKHFLSLYKERGGTIINFSPTKEILADIKNSACIVDAVFGTGFHGEMPEEIRPLAIAIRESVEAEKIAVDVPLGINADDGSVSDFAISVGATVELCFIKPGIISYPARSYVGKIVYDDLSLPRKKITEKFPFKYHMIDSEWVSNTLPKREENSNKGSFGKLLVITGSKKYRGAAHLTVEAALRGGVGLVSFAGADELCRELSAKYPEVIYKNTGDISEICKGDIDELVSLGNKHSAILIGSGSDNTAGLLSLVLAYLSTEGSPVILDADAINALSSIGASGVNAIREAKREVILTPHPLEFARLSETDVATVQLHRLEVAEGFAKENGCTLVLKGAGTIITDGSETFINVSGSSALAKAGSGDALAGFMAAFIAQNKTEISKAASLSVYYHAVAGESLAEEYSSYGVTPSDLPKEMARQIALGEK